MRKNLIILTATLLVTLTAKGQNLFLVGENSYPCTETIILKANSDDGSNLSISLAKDEEKGLFAVSSESSFGAIFSEKLIIYLVDGTVITCKNRGPYDYVDNRAKAVYLLTSDQLNKLKNSNIHTVRYTLKAPSDENSILNLEWNNSASNKGIPTKTIFTDFFDHGISKIDFTYDDHKSERMRLEEEQRRRTEIMNRSRNAIENANVRGSDTSSEGIAGGEGNQGVETGSVDYEIYGEGAETGTEGISYDLAGRQARSLPGPTHDIQSEGIVVVEVTVDRNGNVTKAVPGVKGSTTLEEYFLRVARNAAMESKFDRKPDAPVIQKGTITYHFILR